MTVTQIDVAIIGAGTAGLSARAEVAKVTDNYRVFDPGPLGTTCARTGCMPSKAFLQSAHDYHRREAFAAVGLEGGDQISAVGAQVLAKTRGLRDDFADGVIDNMQSWCPTHLVQHAPEFLEDGTMLAGDAMFRAKATVIASGTRPVVPPGWQDTLGDRLLTTETFFEMNDLPGRIAVIGLGPVGLELGQALARLGVDVTGFDPGPMFGGISDPSLQSCLEKSIGRELKILPASAEPRLASDGSVTVSWAEGEINVDYVLAAVGRSPNIDSLKLGRIGIALSKDGHPVLPPGQLNVPGTSIYFAGDVSGGPALLHEAADEGRIAGFYAARRKDADFTRRVPLRIVFTDPQIASVGATFGELQDAQQEIAIGSASFASAGRARLARATGGTIRIYADKATARLCGAAIMGPQAEHLAHLLAFAICGEACLNDLLRMPFYHPTHEEVLRRAIRAALAECDVKQEPLEHTRCRDTPVDEGMAARPV
jgi:dihydrolipoamide dehydrogenase